MPVQTRQQTRAHFNSSALVRCLSGLATDTRTSVASSASETVAERLAQWLAWTDAQALFSELQGGRPANAPMARPAAVARAEAAIDEFKRTRAELARIIDAETVLADAAADAATRRRHALALQRTMENRLQPLRANVRAALAALSPALARLAALDALMEQALAARERHLLSAVPAWLAPNHPTAANPRALQDALLAELDTRLLPIEGMVDTLAAARVQSPR